MRNRKILVTGASGAIGGALRDIAPIEFADREFVFISSKECDLTDPDAARRMVAEANPDAIIHLAAVAGGVGLNKTHPATLLRDNVRMSLNVLEAAREHSVGKVAMALSSGTYPKDAPFPLNEDSLHEGYPDESNYAYAFAKRLIDPMIRAYRSEYGMSVIGLLPNNTIGEHSSFREGDSGVVPALIRRFVEGREGHEPLTVWGDGTPLREITYAKDAARIFMWCLDNYDEGQVLNMGTTEEISIRDIAFTIADTLMIDRERVVFDSSKASGPVRKNTDTSRLEALKKFEYRPARDTISAITTYFEGHASVPGTLRL